LTGTVLATDKPPISAYTVPVQVTGSWMALMVYGPSSSTYSNHVAATIEGVRYELQTGADRFILLKPGTYQARVTRSGKIPFEVDSQYEMLLPDGSRRTFEVVGVGDVARAGM